MLQGINDAYEFVKMTNFHASSFGINEIRMMMRNLYIEKLSSSEHSTKIAGREAAMVTSWTSAKSNVTTIASSATTKVIVGNERREAHHTKRSGRRKIEVVLTAQLHDS